MLEITFPNYIENLDPKTLSNLLDERYFVVDFGDESTSAIQVFQNYFENVDSDSSKTISLNELSSSIVNGKQIKGYFYGKFNIDYNTPLTQDLIESKSYLDNDNDGIEDLYEHFIYFTDPNHKDTDKDGLSDDDEINNYGSNPLLKDSDSDKLFDIEEIAGIELPEWVKAPSTDYKQFQKFLLDDMFENRDGSRVLKEEYNSFASDPLKYDSDDDGFNDSDERLLGLNPIVDNIQSNILGNLISADLYYSKDFPTQVYLSQNEKDQFYTNYAKLFYPTGELNLWEEFLGLFSLGPIGVQNQKVENFLIWANKNEDGDAKTNGEEFFFYNTDPQRVNDSFSQLTVKTSQRLENYANIQLDKLQQEISILDKDSYEFKTYKSDADYDGLTFKEEIIWKTDEASADSDSDGLSDGAEITFGTDPNDKDSDSDGVLDGDEIVRLNELGLSTIDAEDSLLIIHELLTNDDTDKDGISDLIEDIIGSNKYSADSDGDGISDREELKNRTNLISIDTDLDGMAEKPVVNRDPGDQNPKDRNIFVNKILGTFEPTFKPENVNLLFKFDYIDEIQNNPILLNLLSLEGGLNRKNMTDLDYFKYIKSFNEKIRQYMSEGKLGDFDGDQIPDIIDDSDIHSYRKDPETGADIWEVASDSLTDFFELKIQKDETSDSLEMHKYWDSDNDGHSDGQEVLGSIYSDPRSSKSTQAYPNYVNMR